MVHKLGCVVGVLVMHPSSPPPLTSARRACQGGSVSDATSPRLPRRTALRSAAAVLAVVTTGATTSCSVAGPAHEPHELRVKARGAGAVDPAGAGLDATTAAAADILLEHA